MNSLCPREARRVVGVSVVELLLVTLFVSESAFLSDGQVESSGRFSV